MGTEQCPRSHAEGVDKYHVCRDWSKPARKEVEEPDPEQENAVRALEEDQSQW